MNLSEVLSYNVRRLMASKSPPWTNAKLGEAIGVASPHISPLLKGIVWPSAERIQKIADVLGVVPAMLFIPPCEKPKRRRVRPEHHEFNAEKISTLLDSQDHESGREVTQYGYVRTTGNSLNERGIFHGDWLLFRQMPRIEANTIVVAWIADEECLSLKQYSTVNSQAFLIITLPKEGPIASISDPASPSGASVTYIQPDDHIYGAYAGVIRLENY